jgi:ribosome biogenesis GTPase / thiamine phosphate phosphatase
MRGLVYKSTGSWYQVKDDTGNMRHARIKGIFKIDDITSTNPIAVGDEVEFEEEESGDETVVITEIHPRRNYINRQSPRARHHQHILAANLDQSLLIATLREPRTSTGFIDRFLLASEMYHVPAAILFNKTDVYREKENAILHHLDAVYSTIGYPVLSISMKEKTGLEKVEKLLAGKTTLISGHSGVGKSSFINHLIPDISIKTKDVSGWSGKGQHTTTFAEMYDLPAGGRVIDSPGMREFALASLRKEEVSGYFPEMRKILAECQFNNCMHMNEPGCAVKEAVMEGLINEDRYLNYISIVDSLPGESWK